MDYPQGAVMRVAASSELHGVAGAVSHALRQHGSVTLSSVGPSALSQAVKAMVIARRFLIEDGLDMDCVPSFDEFEGHQGPRTAIQFTIARRPLS